MELKKQITQMAQDLIANHNPQSPAEVRDQILFEMGYDEPQKMSRFWIFKSVSTIVKDIWNEHWAWADDLFYLSQLSANFAVTFREYNPSRDARIYWDDLGNALAVTPDADVVMWTTTEEPKIYS